MASSRVFVGSFALALSACAGRAPSVDAPLVDAGSIADAGDIASVDAGDIAIVDAGVDAGDDGGTVDAGIVELVDAGAAVDAGGAVDAGESAIPYVFVIAMENKADTRIYGNALAPYLNAMMLEYAYASAYADCLPGLQSEPHYVWLEAGTNVFDDHQFLTNSDPSVENSTADTRHIAAQLVTSGRSWRAYQEGLDPATTGACPIHEAGFYAPKHNPFVFFHDVVGSPPSATNTFCAERHRPYVAADFAADLAAGDVEPYTFITPDQCNDMHGRATCSNGCTSTNASACISEGDRWLAENVPPILSFLDANGGVLLIVWDESEGGASQPFLVMGPGVKPGHVSDVVYDHSSYVKSLQMIFGLEIDPRVSAANDFADFFAPGQFP